MPGQYSFAAFDALGAGRSDGAAAFGYRTPDMKWWIATQTGVANLPGVTDDVSTDGISYNDNRHVSAYFNYGSDTGTNVLDGAQAQRYVIRIYQMNLVKDGVGKLRTANI
jgi:hypothetical protein